jgi:8-oxo-dGTP pyrophosphatase MutT (NUDIX family)
MNLLLKSYKVLKDNMYERQRALEKYCAQQEELLGDIVEKSNAIEDGLEFEPDGWKWMALRNKQRTAEDISQHYFREVVKQEAALLRLQKIEETLASISEEVRALKKYARFDTEEAFNNKIVKVARAHKQGLISDGDLVTSQQDALKYKVELVKGKSYVVRDNRTHYADMILVNNEGKVLLGKRSFQEGFEPGKYGLIGGHVEPAEDAKKAAIRETKEEIGITLAPKDVREAGVYEDHTCHISYFVAPYRGEIELLKRDEIINYKWHTLQELLASEELILNLGDNFRNEIIKIPAEMLEVKTEEYDVPILENEPTTEEIKAIAEAEKEVEKMEKTA